MYRKTEPKNKNITVRVTNNEHSVFTDIAYTNDLSASEWANHILSKHKDSYGKTENIEEMIEGIDLTIENIEFMYEVLEKLQSEYKTFYNKTASLAITKMKLTEKMIKMTKFKNRIQN